MTERLALLLNEKHRRLQFNKLSTFYPDTGPLRRELYTKHLEFFKAGAIHQERAAIAGNRCISPWTYLEMGESRVLSAIALTSEAPIARAWAGELECDAPIVGGFVRGIEQAFRVVLDNGEFFDCSRKHQVLTSEGWTSFGQLVSNASGLRLWSKLSNYQANCEMGGYLGDQQLRPEANIFLKKPPSQGDARQRARLIFDNTDEVARRREYIRAYPGADRLSSRGDLERLSDLFSDFSGAFCATPVLPLSDDIEAFRSLLFELNAQRLDSGEFSPSLPGDISRYLKFSHVSCGALNSPSEPPQLHQLPWQSCDFEPFEPSFLKFFHDGQNIAIFFPFNHLNLVGGRRIHSIVPLGFQPIIDAHVPVFNNYKAAGVYHHNCGKTVLSCYETALHLTGLYPKWWEGRRFTHPVDWWAAGETSETTRDILQFELLGPLDQIGTGLIPKDCIIGDPTRRRGVADAIDTARVRHVSGGVSSLGFKSYDQGREKFQGTAKHGISLDEEPDSSVYFECLARLMTTNGLMICTFTPLLGMSEIVQLFLPSMGEVSA